MNAMTNGGDDDNQPMMLNGAGAERLEADGGELLTEARVAAELGIGRDCVRRLRMTMLAEGPDWRRLGRAVVLTEQGVAKIALEAESDRGGGVGMDQVDERAERARVGAAAASGAATSLLTVRRKDIVVRRVVRNPRILEGLVDGEVVRVLVRPSRFWAPGMVLPGCLHEGGDLWRYVGRNPKGWRRW